MTRQILVVLLLGFLAGSAQAQELSVQSLEEFKQRDIDRLSYLKKKKRLREERHEAWFEHRARREALDHELERARVEYIAERDKVQSRMPASSEVLDDKRRHKEKKRMIATEREAARQVYIAQREKVRLTKRKAIQRDLRKQIQELEEGLESD